ncbi:MAG: ATP synthase F1 subunit gamma [Candidatus Liptonbacteria bacterium CG11_big_fil_rev_8_21_14_0_20_35_14]|uniref:ATP synthase gamma chain n=1 Tax=Candidatus Liptonbacteria bacterium CG11_big_fil_rev_8_21_14_0_20_35_14 TaxID=1974634 RepID=A0A2H0N7I4_9BACT|nr:MAG: ATP synthase F1 subunit gamma [Candidatus Liptonbacteria bacterium CG11_big_fil_rev_8_21_14_0_20_35_14]
MATTRETLSKIQSVKNTKKITIAMELVASSKQRKAVLAVLKTRSYANLSWLTVKNVVKMARYDKKMHELLHDIKQIKKVGVILISSNRGLCGGFNSLVIKKAYDFIKEEYNNSDASFILIGKKGRAIESRFNQKIDKYFEVPDYSFHLSHVSLVAKYVIEKYLNGEYDAILLVYTDYISGVKQTPRVKHLLPLHLNQFDTHLGVVDFGEDIETKEKEVQGIINLKQDKYFAHTHYELEPTPYEVLDKMIPKLIEIQIFQALLESSASLHNQRMIAMHKATEAAEEKINDLTLTYNKARQASITTTTLEIVAGAESLNK